MKRWLSSLPADKPLAVITASSVNALSFARSLGRRGIPVLILDSDRHLAVHTRYARVIQLESCRQNPGSWIETLTEVGQQLKTPGVLIPTADPHTVLLSDNRQILKPFFNFLCPPEEQARQYVSKQFQISHARGLGIPVPETWLPANRQELEALEPELTYPCMLKPDRSHSGAKVLAGDKLLVVNSAAKLLDAHDKLAADNVPMFVQEIIPGPDTELVSYLGFWGSAGEETAYLTKRKLRQFPAHFGNGSLQCSEELPEIAEISRRFLQGLNYCGFAGLEFKFDHRDGSFRFIELNPRSSAMNELAIAAGVDFPWIAYQSLAGRDHLADSRQTFRPGVKCVNEEWDLQAYLELRRRGELTFRQWRASLSGAHKVIAAMDDPAPLMAGLARAIFPPLRQGRRP